MIRLICAIAAVLSCASAKGYGGGAGAHGGAGHGGAAGYGGIAHGGAAGYGGVAHGGAAAGYGGVVHGVAAGYGAGHGFAGGYGYGGGPQIFAPKPYDFAYDAPDGYGNSHFRKEQADASGNVQGSYGYTDSQGLYRQVDYVANAGGFHATVRTNEPGTDGKENPADVNVIAQPPPPGVQEKYTRPAVYGGGPYAHGGAIGLGAVGASHGGAAYGGGGAFRSSHGYSFGGSHGGYNLAGKFGGAGAFTGVARSTSGKSGY